MEHLVELLRRLLRREPDPPRAVRRQSGRIQRGRNAQTRAPRTAIRRRRPPPKGEDLAGGRPIVEHSSVAPGTTGESRIVGQAVPAASRSGSPPTGQPPTSPPTFFRGVS